MWVKRVTGFLLFLLLLQSGSMMARPALNNPPRTYKVAMILPLHLNDYNGANVNRANIMLDYYQGFFLGLKEYEAQGLNLKLSVFDNQHDTGITRQLLENPAMKGMDLIIAPILPEHLYILNHFSSKNQVAVWSPFTATDSLFPNNPLFFNAAPAEKTKAELFYEYYRKTAPEKELLIISNDGNPGLGFEKNLIELLASKPGISYRILPASEMGQADTGYFAKGKEYLIYHFAESGKEIKQLTNLLDRQKAVCEVIGDYKLATLKSFNKFRRDKYNFKIIAGDYINPLDSSIAIMDFRTTYKLNYSLNPSRYSFIGHDQAAFISENLMKYDRFRANDFTGETSRYFAVRFIFKKDRHCNQNKGLFILKVSGDDLAEEVKF